MKIKWVIVFLLVCTTNFAQTSLSSLLFKKGDRVCFVGNSITRNGEFYKNILLYYITRFPDEKITFFDCGISGDDCSKIKRRIDDDVLIHHPTHIVIMAGMNDVSRNLYGENPTRNKDTLAKRQRAIDTYKIRLDSIVQLFLSKGLKVILQKPTIYDQTANLIETNHLGVNDALKICADYVQTLADQYQLPVVDYWNILNKANTDLQKENPANTIIGADRIHPGSPGHFMMSYEFLKSSKAPQYVANIVAVANKEVSNSKSNGCLFLSFKVNPDSIVFAVLEKSLPFPIKSNQQQALHLVPFVKELNNESLQVFINNGKSDHLSDTLYNLTIDDNLIKVVSVKELSQGINLSQNLATPQYNQAKRVSALVDSMWDVIYQLRTIGFIEYNYLAAFQGNKANTMEKLAYLQMIVDSLKLSPDNFIRMQFDDYKYFMSISSKEKLENKVESFLARAYEEAKPKVHTYRLKKVVLKMP